MPSPERRAEAQIAYRELHYAREDKKIGQEEYERAMREWAAEFPEFMPGDGCCGNVAPREEYL